MCVYLSNEEWHFVTVKLVSDITFDIDKSHCGSDVPVADSPDTD